jgi:hypothetical protein
MWRRHNEMPRQNARITIYTTEDLKKRFKKRVVDYGTSMEKVVNELVDGWLLTHPAVEPRELLK